MKMIINDPTSDQTHAQNFESERAEKLFEEEINTESQLPLMTFHIKIPW